MKLLCVLVAVVMISSTIGDESCDDLGVVMYEDMSCRPVKSPSNRCPSSFECDDLKKSNSQCFYQGKTYSIGQKIDKNSIGFSCEFGCFCNSGRDNETSRIFCAQFGCGEWSGLPPSPGCYRQYDLEKCCSIGEKCEQNVTTICTVDGIDYKEGERFSPKNSCHVCICQKGFVSGKYAAPFCKRSGCDVQLRNHAEVQKSCAPVYVKRQGDGDKLCCPRQWTCPDGTEKFENKPGNVTTPIKCQYGDNRFFNIGDVFTKSNKIRCECKIPPLLTCVQN